VADPRNASTWISAVPRAGRSSARDPDQRDALAHLRVAAARATFPRNARLDRAAALSLAPLPREHRPHRSRRSWSPPPCPMRAVASGCSRTRLSRTRSRLPARTRATQALPPPRCRSWPGPREAAVWRARRVQHCRSKRSRTRTRAVDEAVVRATRSRCSSLPRDGPRSPQLPRDSSDHAAPGGPTSRRTCRRRPGRPDRRTEEGHGRTRIPTRNDARPPGRVPASRSPPAPPARPA
jgi:hypothetical protein